MPIFDAMSDNTTGGVDTYDDSTGHVADLGLPSDGHGLVTVDVFGWCPQDSGGVMHVCRRWRDLKLFVSAGVVSLEPRDADVDTTDPGLAGAVVSISTPGGTSMISVDVVGVPGTVIAWEADIQVHGQTPPSF